MEQVRPAGELVMVPLPVPQRDTLSVLSTVAGITEKIAEADFEDERVTAQFPVPEHTPPHPVKL